MSSGATTYASAMTYKPFGALESMSLGNGTVYSISYSDARLQLTSIALRQGAATLQRYDYTYGAVDAATGAVDASKNAGQVATIESRIGEQRQWQQRFSYDTLGRLSSAAEYSGDTLQNRSYLLSYGYDCYGNRYQHSSRNQNNPFAQSWVEDGSFDAATNRFTSGVTYDDAGNVTIDSRFGRLSFLYDANNRQRQSSNLDGSNAVESVYDGAGRRVAVKAGGAVTNVMVYDASGELVAEYGGVASANGTSYVMADAQGSTRVVTGGGGGVVSRRDYLPFGEEVAQGVGGRSAAQGYGGADEVRRGYAGMEWDEATRMSHTLWREYDSLSGRWTAPDPYGGSMTLADPQSLNRYTYVNNDLVNQTDPAGLALSDIGVHQTTNAAVATRLERARDQYTRRYMEGQTGAAQRQQRMQQFNSSFGRGTPPSLMGSTQKQSTAQPEQEQEAQTRSYFPVFTNQAEQDQVNMALSDARAAVTTPLDGVNAFSLILNAAFRRPGDQTTAEEAMDSVKATGGIEVIRNQGGVTFFINVKQNVFDGRISTLPVPDDNGATVTVAQYFKNYPNVNATYFSGQIFLGRGFFNEDRDGRARSMIHEGVVYQGFNRSDLDFGPIRTEGSQAINRIIDRYYRWR